MTYIVGGSETKVVTQKRRKYTNALLRPTDFAMAVPKRSLSKTQKLIKSYMDDTTCS